MVPRSADGRQTRDRILDAAARLFVERGYEATSVREIAAAIGISNPSLYHHFASKGDLLQELLADPLQRVGAAVEEAATLHGEARTRRILHGLLEALEVHNGIAVAGLRQAGSSPAAELGLAAAARPMVYELLRGEAKGEDPDLQMRMVVGAVERVVMDLMTASTGAEDFAASLRRRRDAIVDQAVRMLR